MANKTKAKAKPKALELITIRNRMYYDESRGIILTFLLLLLVLIGMVAYFFTYSTKLSPPIYFPTMEDGQVIFDPDISENHLLLENFTVNPDTGNLIEKSTGREWPDLNIDSLDTEMPNANEDAIVLDWAVKATKQMFDLDYINYRSNLHRMRGLFTSAGYIRFIEALKDSKNLDAIKKRKLVPKVLIDGKPKIIKKYFKKGHRVWTIDIRCIISYENKNLKEPLDQGLISRIEIARVSTLGSPRYGLKIFRNNTRE